MAAAEFILACFKSKTREKIYISSAATKNGKEVSLLWKMQYGDARAAGIFLDVYLPIFANKKIKMTKARLC